MAPFTSLQVGQTVELADGRTATVQFVGPTSFAPGDWVGVELGDASGKNDGSVQGQRYFDCPPGHGMFVRPAAATVLEQATPTPAVKPAMSGKPTSTVTRGRSNGTTTRPRPSSGVGAGVSSKRQSMVGASSGTGTPAGTTDAANLRRQSVNAPSPSPVSRVSRISSPSKSPTKQLGSGTASATSTRTGTPSGPGKARTSMLPPSSKPSRTSMAAPAPLSSAGSRSRPSIASAFNGAARSGTSPAKSRTGSVGHASLSPRDRKLGSMSGESRVSMSSLEETDPAVLSPSVLSNEDERSSEVSLKMSASTEETPKAKPSSVANRTRSPPTATISKPHSATSASTREVEDLKTKLRVMEKKRLEDREKIKALDKIKSERDKFEGIIQKLQSKYQPQQQEISTLKKQIHEEEEKMNALEGQLAEHETLMEVATLDREMAEETAESMRLELESLRQKHEEIELEVAVLREENEELGKEISPEEKTSQGWLQMERTNDRLREALLRLRDMTQEQEAELKDQLAEMEADLQDYNKLKDEHTSTVEDLEQTNATMEDLRQQLDTALGAEDMIEELTEKNMALTEKMEEMKLAIEDLESLKELNDELEINHVETEKQLQEEIDYSEGLLAEEARKAAVQDGTIQDLEYTVTRFRDLVANMQSDLEDMRASQQITESEATELSNKSRAMMDLNMKLQYSAAKTQIKAIDQELGKMQAQESSEHLSIVQLFLPDTFKSEQDSVQALLRVRRIEFKAQMMHNFVRDRMNGPVVSTNDEDLFAFGDVLDKLVWIMATCSRFINKIGRSDLQEFKKLGAALYELDPVERALNVSVEVLRRNDLKPNAIAEELQRSIALMSHLAELHINDSIENFPDQILAQAAVMQSHAETAALALTQLKFRLESVDPLQGNEETSEEVEAFEYSERLDSLISQSRTAKVVITKATKQLEDFKSRNLTLDPSTLNIVEQTEDSAADAGSSVRHFCTAIVKYLADETQQLDSESSRISQAFASAPLSLPNLSNKIQTAVSHVQTFYNATISAPRTLELPSPAPPAPWRLLADKMRAETADQVAREKELSRLQDELSERNTTLAIREKMLEEVSVKAEVLEKRVSESTSRTERLRELESTAEQFKQSEKDKVGQMSRLREEIERLEGERETWKQQQVAVAPAQDASGAQAKGVAESSGVNTITSAASLMQISQLESEITSLQASIRYLRASQYSSFASASQVYLATPLTHAPSSSTTNSTAITRLPASRSSETRSAVNELLHLVSRPAALEPIKLAPLSKREDRLKWRPARETVEWQVNARREDWAEWAEWRDSLARRDKRKGPLPTVTLPSKTNHAPGFAQKDTALQMDTGLGGAIEIVT